MKQLERIVKSSYKIAPILHEAWAAFARPDADIGYVARSLRIRVWFAWGRRDKVIPLLGCMPCIRRLKNASVLKFKAGHAAFLEQPEAFIREFLNFITALDKTAPRTSFAAPIKYRGEGYERSNSAYR